MTVFTLNGKREIQCPEVNEVFFNLEIIMRDIQEMEHAEMSKCMNQLMDVLEYVLIQEWTMEIIHVNLVIMVIITQKTF